MPLGRPGGAVASEPTTPTRTASAAAPLRNKATRFGFIHTEWAWPAALPLGEVRVALGCVEGRGGARSCAEGRGGAEWAEG